jgi:hypothetical protein
VLSQVGEVGSSIRQNRNLDIQRWLSRSRASGGTSTSEGSSEGVALRKRASLFSIFLCLSRASLGKSSIL